MPTPTKGRRIGGSASHQKHILANLASDLFRHGRIKTTEAKAKALRPYAEKLITKAKNGDLHNRRQVMATIRNKDVTAYLFEEIAPRFADRPGGYTRIMKLGPRPGDNAPMALIELVDRGTGTSGDDAIEDAKAARGRGLFGRRRKKTGVSDTAEVVGVESSDSASEDSSVAEAPEAPAAEASAPEAPVDEAGDDADKA